MFQIVMFPLLFSLECLYSILSPLIVWLTVTHLINLSKDISLNYAYLSAKVLAQISFNYAHIMLPRKYLHITTLFSVSTTKIVNVDI